MAFHPQEQYTSNFLRLWSIKTQYYLKPQHSSIVSNLIWPNIQKDDDNFQFFTYSAHQALDIYFDRLHIL